MTSRASIVHLLCKLRRQRARHENGSMEPFVPITAAIRCLFALSCAASHQTQLSSLLTTRQGPIYGSRAGPKWWSMSLGKSRWGPRSEEHTSELQSLMRISYAVFCLKKKKNNHNNQ